MTDLCKLEFPLNLHDKTCYSFWPTCSSPWNQSAVSRRAVQVHDVAYVNIFRKQLRKFRCPEVSPGVLYKYQNGFDTVFRHTAAAA